MDKNFKVRDLRKKDQYKIDDAYLNGYARLCGIYATAVYNSLSRHADFHTQEAFPSIERIAEQHNISRPSVIKGIQQLEDWGIIKIIREKDEKTKRQKVNVYILVDKIEWKPKPIESRVNEVDTESRVNNRTKPSKRQEKSRVNDVDCKDTGLIKDTQIKVATPSVAGTELVLKETLTLFKELNPSYERFFSNKTERACTERLLRQYGVKKLGQLIAFAGYANKQPYAPTITSPFQMEKNVAKLILFYKKEQTKTQGKGATIIN